MMRPGACMPYDVFGAMKAKCLPIGMGFERFSFLNVLFHCVTSGFPV